MTRLYFPYSNSASLPPYMVYFLLFSIFPTFLVCYSCSLRLFWAIERCCTILPATFLKSKSSTPSPRNPDFPALSSVVSPVHRISYPLCIFVPYVPYVTVLFLLHVNLPMRRSILFSLPLHRSSATALIRW